MSYKTQMNDGGDSSGGIVLTKQPNGDLGRSEGGCGGKAAGQGEHGQSNSCRTPSRISEANGLIRVRPAAVLLDAISKVGTVCVSSASTGLSGGCWVTGIPTGTDGESQPGNQGDSMKER